jgi:hypothetical protein
MGKALELISGFVTAPSTTVTALTMGSGNSSTVRNAPLDSKISLLSAWADNQTAGVLRIKSPRLHDNVQGMRFGVVASEPQPVFPLGMSQKLISQDSLDLGLSGSATAGDIESACMLIYYDNLPGIESRLITAAEAKERAIHIVTVENSLATGTAGGYSGEEALNVEYDLLKANTDYAILGFIVSAECAAVRYRGSDLGNLGVGGPGNDNDQEMTSNWFLTLSEKTGLPLVPVFNSANVDALLIDAVQDENGTDVIVWTILAELSSGA